MEAIILAGGKGTRLQSVVSDVPKPMADINGKPFLCYVLDWLAKQGVSKVVFAVGYKANIIMDYFGNNYNDIGIVYSVETKSLGTGGAIKQALGYCEATDVFVVNGDTLFKVSLHEMSSIHDAALTISCCYQAIADRYGLISIENGFVTLMSEKSKNSSGYINGGVYLMKKNLLDGFPEKFSFEDVLPQLVEQRQVKAKVFDDYFIDIGIPEDYERAGREL